MPVPFIEAFLTNHLKYRQTEEEFLFTKSKNPQNNINFNQV